MRDLGLGAACCRLFAKPAAYCAVVIAVSIISSSLAQEKAVPLHPAVETLRAMMEELRSEDAAYRAARTAGKSSRVELDEYAAFVANLRFRVFAQCEIVRKEAGRDPALESECAGATPGVRLIAVVPSGVIQTEGEKKTGIEARLTALEGEVDESLQKRQQEMRQTAATGGGSGAGGGASGAAGADGGAAGASGATGGGTPGAPQRSGGPSGPSGRTPDGAAGASQIGLPASPSGGQVPSGAAQRQRTTDGASDDDVVARQLREAAERESDPVLKEKLMNEYRKYREAKR